ncbi:hypothetical protein DFAR_2500024 [Desulfarculales bacterium]
MPSATRTSAEDFFLRSKVHLLVSSHNPYQLRDLSECILDESTECQDKHAGVTSWPSAAIRTKRNQKLLINQTHGLQIRQALAPSIVAIRGKTAALQKILLLRDAQPLRAVRLDLTLSRITLGNHVGMRVEPHRQT